MKFALILVSYLLSATGAQASGAHAAETCKPSVEAAPLCPESGSMLLDDRYPIMAATVSTGLGGSQYVTDFIEELMPASLSVYPSILVMASESEFQEILQKIKKANISEEKKQKRIAHLRRMDFVQGDDTKQTNWQMDIFTAQFDRATGLPVLRETAHRLKNMEVRASLVQDISESFAKCGVTTGATLKLESAPDVSEAGMSGGNIAGLPGGLCVVGRDHFKTDDLWKDYAKSACGHLDLVVQAPSDFMAVGHADELVNVVKIPSAKAPCDFALTVASPDEGLRTLRSQPDAPLFDEKILRKFSPSVLAICTALLDSKLQGLKSKGDATASSTSKSVTQIWTKKSSSSRLPAESDSEQIALLTAKLKALDFPRDPEPGAAIKPCIDLKNSDLMKLYDVGIQGAVGDSAAAKFRTVQGLVQKRMDTFKTQLRARLKTALPQCDPKIIDVPYLFDAEFDYRDKHMLGATSLFPNPTNGLMLEKSYLMPSQGNAVFQKAAKDAFKNVGVETRTIDTFFAHSLGGNLHCSSHVLRYCKPRGAK